MEVGIQLMAQGITEEENSSMGKVKATTGRVDSGQTNEGAADLKVPAVCKRNGATAMAAAQSG